MKWVWLINTPNYSSKPAWMIFFPFVIIMSGLLLHLALWGNCKCFSEGKCFQLYGSFKSSIPMYLLETFRKPHYFSHPHLAMWSLPARMLPRPPHQPGLGMECDHEGLTHWSLGPVFMLCLWVREESNYFFSLRIFCQPPAYFKRFKVFKESKDSKSLIWEWEDNDISSVTKCLELAWILGQETFDKCQKNP